MIIALGNEDFDEIHEIINDAAAAYKGIIPEDRWREPYMSRDDLKKQIAEGVSFWGYRQGDIIIGVMGIQPKKDVTLIRHAYVRTIERKKGIGALLLKHLCQISKTPILIGTWAAASWAIAFYEKNGFILLPTDDKNKVLRKYWSIPERQVETSVVLASPNWFINRQS